MRLATGLLRVRDDLKIMAERARVILEAESVEPAIVDLHMTIQT